jgi:hypothetical protein
MTSSKPKPSPTLKKAMKVLKSKIEKPKTKKRSFKHFFKKTLKKMNFSKKNKQKNKKGRKIKGGGVAMPIEYFGGIENPSQWDLIGGNTTWGSSQGLSRGGTML